MKTKSKSDFHDALLMDGTVHCGVDSKGRLWEHGKIVQPAASNVVVRPEPKLNVAPKITDPPKVKTPPTAEQSEAFGLQRCVLANVETQKSGKEQREAKSTYKPTGLWAAMLANVELQKTKTKTS